MKRNLLILSILAACFFSTQAQVNPHAIGLRLGTGGQFFGGEFSYQHGMGAANRLELDLGFGGNSDNNNFYVAGTYQWDWNLTEGLNWFVGPGATLGFQNYDNDGRFNLGIGGQIGLEYDFQTLGAPILVSLDTRPMWNFIGHTGMDWGLALGVRYVW